jgi:hypothetical protein
MKRVGLAILVVVASVSCKGERRQGSAYPVPGESGGAERIVVEVLNASGRPGLARAGTRALRRAGIDVVSFGNAAARPEERPLDSTRILIRRGSATAGERIRRALGTGKVVVQPDSTRLLDASVLLGADFRPGVELHP